MCTNQSSSIDSVTCSRFNQFIVTQTDYRINTTEKPICAWSYKYVWPSQSVFLQWISFICKCVKKDKIQTSKTTVVKYCVRCRTIIRIGRIRFRFFSEYKIITANRFCHRNLFDGEIAPDNWFSSIETIQWILYGGNDNYTCLCKWVWCC